MLDLDMLPLPTDTPPLDTMARGLLMLSPRLRLMLVFTMVDMDMVLDILVLATPDLDMLDTDMAIQPTDTPPLDTMARGLLMLSQRLRLMLVFTMVDMDMVLAILVLAMLVMDMDIPLMVLDTVDTTMVRSISKYVDEAKAQSNHRLAHCYSVPSFEV